MLRPKATKDFMTGIYKTVESQAFAPHIIRKSYADVGLFPWNPTKIRKLCLDHCPPPSLLTGSRVGRKLESILKKLGVEQEAERDQIISIGKLEREGLSDERGGYHLRERKSVDHQESDDDSRRHSTARKRKDSIIQPANKRPSRGDDTH